jgi:uncharacterized protein YhaN
MRIQELNLAAFGPFTDRTLVFDHDAGGLHIVYGPNEAGKSSALRGLKALLYGIEARTLDNFQHDNKNLRISGHLRDADGHELLFARRKGTKNTLLTPDGDPLDDQALLPFLQGVTAEIFETLFGIDHQALVQGGQEILEQKGEVGQTLFSAALGSHALHSVLGRLDEESDELFKPRGSKPIINAALSEYKQLQKKVKEQSLSSRDWEAYRRALDETIKNLEQVQSELNQHRKAVSRLQRIQRILPKVARRRDLLTDLESMGRVLILADDFAERRQVAQKKLETARAMAGLAIPRHESLQQQIENLSISQKFLDQAENIEELHTRLGSHRKAQLDKPHLEAERQQLLTEGEGVLKEIRPDLDLTDIEGLRPVLARRQSIADMGARETLLVSGVEQAESSRRRTELRLKAARRESQELPEMGSSEALRTVIAAARKQGDMDTMIQSAQRDLASLQTRCAAGLSRLTLWDGALEALPGLAVPNQKSIDRFEDAYDDLDKRIQRLREKQGEAADILRDVLLRLDENQRVGNVPTETDLVEARSGRDQIWQLLRRHWFEGEDVSAEEPQADVKGPLPDEFEERVVDTDDLSDRLRREADRVHEIASLQAKQVSVRRQSEEIARQLEECAADKSQVNADWQSLWAACQIQPHSPREMRVWLDDVEKLRDLIGQVHELNRKADELLQTRNTHVHQLNQQLAALGKAVSKSVSLEMVLLECDRFAQQLDESTQQRVLLANEIKTLKNDLEVLVDKCVFAEEKYQEWKVQWQKLLESLGLQANTTPFEVSVFIEKLRELFDKQRDAENLYRRIKSIDQDAFSFLDQVAVIVAGIAPGLTDAPAEDTVLRLNSLLSENRSKRTQREQLKGQIEQAHAEIQAAEATIQAMNERLNSLCIEAKLETHSELEEAERQSALYLKTREVLVAIELEILEAGDGASIVALEAEAEGIDRDELPGRIEALKHKINDELEPRRTELAQARGREEKELELMDGSDQAAELADRAQALLAGIRSNAEHYVRVKLAGRVLRDEIERYRKENQGPLVKRASEHFAALTLGSFERLMADFDEKDQPVLVGIRPDGERVYVAGMSSGTRDQLYLALRLASLEKYLRDAEPMPFIVDDILVDFDDERSEAALNGLAALAEKTQVIVFTHHSQVVEQAKKIQGAGPVQVHTL